MTLKISRSQVSTQPNPWMDPTQIEPMTNSGTVYTAQNRGHILTVYIFTTQDINLRELC